MVFYDVVSEQVESHIKKMHKEKGVKVVELPKEAKIEMITAPSSAKMNRNKTGNITFFWFYYIKQIWHGTNMRFYF
jgi:hypothetical protein